MDSLILNKGFAVLYLTEESNGDIKNQT